MSAVNPQIDFGPTLGALLIGLILGSVFLGITFLQTVFYYKTYPEDSVFLKSLVGALCALDTLSLVLWAHSTYWYLVLNFGNVVAANTVVWSDAIELPVTGIIALTVHLFLAWRIKILNNSWRTFSVLLAMISSGSVFSPIVATVIEVIGMQKEESIFTVYKTARWCAIVGDVLSAVVDVSIAGSIAYLLHRGRGESTSRTNRILSGLTQYIITSGVITAIARLVQLILTFAYPSAFYFLIPYISASKAYTNTLLATLNSRVSQRDGFLSVKGTTIQWRGLTVDSVEETDMPSKGPADSECSMDLNAKGCGSGTSKEG